MNQIAPSAEHLWLVPNLHDAGCHGSLAVVGMRLEALNAQVVMLASLVLAGCAASEQGDRTVACAPFQAGWACSPNTQYVTIIQGESTASQCAEACEKIGNNGCCWHSEEPDASDSCQWVLGGQARDYGGPTVRSAAQCTGGAPPPPPLPQQLHIALGNMSDSMLVQWAVPHLGGTVASPNAVLRYQAVGDTDWVSVPSQVQCMQCPPAPSRLCVLNYVRLHFSGRPKALASTPNIGSHSQPFNLLHGMPTRSGLRNRMIPSWGLHSGHSQSIRRTGVLAWLCLVILAGRTIRYSRTCETR